jgi:hypothetical protein
MATTELAQPKPALKKSVASKAKKTAAIAPKTAAKKHARETGDVMLWADIV